MQKGVVEAADKPRNKKQERWKTDAASNPPAERRIVSERRSVQNTGRQRITHHKVIRSIVPWPTWADRPEDTRIVHDGDIGRRNHDKGRRSLKIRGVRPRHNGKALAVNPVDPNRLDA